MDRSTPIYLASKTYSQNAYGVTSASLTLRKVYAQVNSVSQAEWFEGGRNGLNPEYRFSMFAPDYEGEEIVQYNDNYYAVYRTYRAKNEIIELYCEKNKGVDYSE